MYHPKIIFFFVETVYVFYEISVLFELSKNIIDDKTVLLIELMLKIFFIYLNISFIIFLSQISISKILVNLIFLLFLFVRIENNVRGLQ